MSEGVIKKSSSFLKWAMITMIGLIFLGVVANYFAEHFTPEVAKAVKGFFDIPNVLPAAMFLFLLAIAKVAFKVASWNERGLLILFSTALFLLLPKLGDVSNPKIFWFAFIASIFITWGIISKYINPHRA